MAQIALVTPVWNDSARLEAFGFELAEALRGSGLSVRWLVSDDGSSASEKVRLMDLVKAFAEVYPGVELIEAEVRSRKGAAVYRAWDVCGTSDLLAFVDADGAIDADSVVRFLRSALEPEVSGAAFVGVRRSSGTVSVRRSFLRGLSNFLFRSVVCVLVGLRCSDSQCGMKVIPGKVYRKVRKTLVETGYVFDVELLLALEGAGLALREQPVAWCEVPGGKVSPLRDAWPMVLALFRLRRRLRAGVYLD